MRDVFGAMLERYGQEAVLERTKTSLRAFLQPVLERNERETGEYPSLGWLDARLWRYLGREALEVGDVLCWQGLRLRVQSVRAVCLGEKILYRQGVLTREAERT